MLLLVVLGQSWPVSLCMNLQIRRLRMAPHKMHADLRTFTAVAARTPTILRSQTEEVKMTAHQQATAPTEPQHHGIHAGLEILNEDNAHRMKPSPVLRFRSFSLLPGARMLLAGNSAVPIGSRAFDLLVVLAQARGTLVTKEVIIQQVWPSTIVEESNLRFQMACVRKALGRDRDLIKSIPGRGYLLAADVDEQFLHPALLEGVPKEEMADRARPPVWRGPIPARRREDGSPTVVLFSEDEPTRERVQALLRLVGLQVQLFGSVDAFLSDIQGSA
jgi:DNA-binding winged helix-turn-helix (wHTH) protein